MKIWLANLSVVERSEHFANNRWVDEIVARPIELFNDFGHGVH
jgi:hypothetical protein